jgi:hypothetical protein
MVMKKITDGERPKRPQKSAGLGLSDELWAVVDSSLAREAGNRPPITAFVDLLERANPDISVLEKLTNFDASSDEDITKLRHIFGYRDNTLLGMREDETLVLIEVFDRVSFPVSRLAALPRSQLIEVLGPKFIA